MPNILTPDGEQRRLAWLGLAVLLFTLVLLPLVLYWLSRALS